MNYIDDILFPYVQMMVSQSTSISQDCQNAEQSSYETLLNTRERRIWGKMYIISKKFQFQSGSSVDSHLMPYSLPASLCASLLPDGGGEEERERDCGIK